MNNNKLRLMKIHIYKTINNYINSLFKIETIEPKANYIKELRPTRIHYIDFEKIHNKKKSLK